MHETCVGQAPHSRTARLWRLHLPPNCCRRSGSLPELPVRLAEHLIAPVACLAWQAFVTSSSSAGVMPVGYHSPLCQKRRLHQTTPPQPHPELGFEQCLLHSMPFPICSVCRKNSHNYKVSSEVLWIHVNLTGYCDWPCQTPVCTANIATLESLTSLCKFAPA